MAKSISPFQQFGMQLTPAASDVRFHTFRQGDTLSGLAYRYYRDWTQWRLIADANQVRDPRQIEPGTVLQIPGVPPQTGQYEVFSTS